MAVIQYPNLGPGQGVNAKINLEKSSDSNFESVFQNSAQKDESLFAEENAKMYSNKNKNDKAEISESDNDEIEKNKPVQHCAAARIRSEGTAEPPNRLTHKADSNSDARFSHLGKFSYYFVADQGEQVTKSTIVVQNSELRHIISPRSNDKSLDTPSDLQTDGQNVSTKDWGPDRASKIEKFERASTHDPKRCKLISANNIDKNVNFKIKQHPYEIEYEITHIVVSNQLKTEIGYSADQLTRVRTH